MCTAKSEGGIRCGSHALKALKNAKESGDEIKIREAEDDYYCTNQGILELEENGDDYQLRYYLDLRIRRIQRDRILHSKNLSDAKEAAEMGYELYEIDNKRSPEEKEKLRVSELAKIKKGRPDFAKSEEKLISLFAPGAKFVYNEKEFVSLYSGKPKSQGRGGEGKTDVFIVAKDQTGQLELIKISYKQKNADAYESWVTAERAEEIFGAKWKQVMKNSINENAEGFYTSFSQSKPVGSAGEPDSYVLGYAFDIRSNPRKLSTKLSLSNAQKKDIYSGSNMSPAKRNSIVKGKQRPDSGVASHILVADNVKTPQEAIDKMMTIDDYVKNHPQDLYITYKAVNAQKDKNYEVSKRSLAVTTKYQLQKNGSIDSKLFTDASLGSTSQDAGKDLVKARRAQEDLRQDIRARKKAKQADIK